MHMMLCTVRCSATPLRTNPFDATLQRLGRNFTSKNRFLDMIADGLDRLSAPSANDKASGNAGPGRNGAPSANQTRPTLFANATNKPAANNAKDQPAAPQQPLNNNDSLGRILKYLVTSANARYSRHSLLSVLVQVLVNASGGYVFAQAFVLPHLGRFAVPQPDAMHDAAAVVVVLSCLLVPVFELFSSINEAELDYRHYSSLGGSLSVGSRHFRLRPLAVALGKDALHRATMAGHRSAARHLRSPRTELPPG